MSDLGDPGFAQVLDRQSAQDLRVNVVLAKRRLILGKYWLGKPEIAQPVRDIHRLLPIHSIIACNRLERTGDKLISCSGEVRIRSRRMAR